MPRVGKQAPAGLDAEVLARRLFSAYRLAVKALIKEGAPTKGLEKDTWDDLNEHQQRGHVLFALELLKNPPPELSGQESAKIKAPPSQPRSISLGQEL